MSEARLNWTLGASRIDLHLDGDEDIGILWDATVDNVGLAARMCHRYNGYEEMRQALENLYNSVDSCMELTPEVMLKARAALAKAKGEIIEQPQS